jgi:hypothetical protein
MELIGTFMKRSGRILFLGMFLTLLLQACTTNLTVKCGPGGMTQTEDGVGACNPVDYTGSANGFWNTENPSTTYQGGGNCVAGSKKCASSPGRCASGAGCKSWVTPSTMVCKCDCNP